MEVRQIGNFLTCGSWDNPQCGRVYSVDGIAPTITTCGGGNRRDSSGNHKWGGVLYLAS